MSWEFCGFGFVTEIRIGFSNRKTLNDPLLAGVFRGSLLVTCDDDVTGTEDVATSTSFTIPGSGSLGPLQCHVTARVRSPAGQAASRAGAGAGAGPGTALPQPSQPPARRALQFGEPAAAEGSDAAPVARESGTDGGCGGGSAQPVNIAVHEAEMKEQLSELLDLFSHKLDP